MNANNTGLDYLLPTPESENDRVKPIKPLEELFFVSYKGRPTRLFLKYLSAFARYRFAIQGGSTSIAHREDDLEVLEVLQHARILRRGTVTFNCDPTKKNHVVLPLMPFWVPRESMTADRLLMLADEKLFEQLIEDKNSGC